MDFFAIQHFIRQNAFKSLAEDAFFTAAMHFDIPRNIPDILDKPVVRKRNPDFEARPMLILSFRSKSVVINQSIFK